MDRAVVAGGRRTASWGKDWLTRIGLAAGVLGLLTSAVLANAAGVTAGSSASSSPAKSALYVLHVIHHEKAPPARHDLEMLLLAPPRTTVATDPDSSAIPLFSPVLSKLNEQATAPPAVAAPVVAAPVILPVHATVPVTAPPAVSAAVPPRGQARGYGCGAALAYLAAYAAPGFVVECPAYAGGHQATTTCANGAYRCSGMKEILIADPCPAAYMNEASNSYVISGLASAPIDPYGSCY